MRSATGSTLQDSRFRGQVAALNPDFAFRVVETGELQTWIFLRNLRVLLTIIQARLADQVIVASALPSPLRRSSGRRGEGARLPALKSVVLVPPDLRPCARPSKRTSFGGTSLAQPFICIIGAGRLSIFGEAFRSVAPSTTPAITSPFKGACLQDRPIANWPISTRLTTIGRTPACGKRSFDPPPHPR